MAEKNNSLEKALTVLDLFQTRRRITLTEAAQETGFSNAAISRILNSLENMHYIYHDKIDSGYYLTDKLYVLGRNTNLKNEIVNVIEEPVGYLCKRSGFSVTVGVRNGIKSITALREDPQNGLGLSLIPSTGETLSLNCTATGKVLTAFSGKAEQLADQIEYVQLTKKSIVSREEFMETISEVRRQRLAFDMEEVTEGLVCVAAPVLAKDGIAICSVSVSGYKERMLRELYTTITRLQDCVKTCEQLMQ